jgi:hypothetical protein
LSDSAACSGVKAVHRARIVVDKKMRVRTMLSLPRAED